MPGGELGAGAADAGDRAGARGARTGRRRRRAAAWIVRRCGTGCIAITPRGWRGSRIGRDPVRPRGCHPRSSRRKSKVDAGPAVEEHGVVRWRGSTWRGRSRSGSGWSWRSVPSGAADVGAIPGCRRGRSIGRPILPPKRRTKNFAAGGGVVLPEPARVQPLEIWFQDEARIGQQGTRPGSGPSPAAGRGRSGTRYKGPTCSGRSVRPAASAPPWWCRTPTSGR